MGLEIYKIFKRAIIYYLSLKTSKAIEVRESILDNQSMKGVISKVKTIGSDEEEPDKIRKISNIDDKKNHKHYEGSASPSKDYGQFVI